jgi:hypothetical protein
MVGATKHKEYITYMFEENQRPTGQKMSEYGW